MKSKVSLSRAVVIPCYNEEQRIQSSKFVSLVTNYNCHLFFVDDGSLDGTVGKIMSLPIPKSSFHLVSLESNVGKAEAILQGISHALRNGYDYVGLYDADGAINPKDLGFAFSLIETNEDVSVVSGARILLAGNEVTRKPNRRWAGRIIATVVSLMLKIQIYDPQSPCKVYKASELKKLSGLQLRTRWFVDAELLFAIKCLPPTKKWLLEFPVTNWEDVDGSNISLKSVRVVLRDLFNLLKITR